MSPPSISQLSSKHACIGALRASYGKCAVMTRFLALALWLDMGPLDTTLRSYPPSGNFCDDSGVCSWAVADAPMHNR